MLRFGRHHAGQRRAGGGSGGLRSAYLAPRRPPGKDYDAPHYAELRTETAVGGVQRRALAVPSPTTLQLLLEVPAGRQRSASAWACHGDKSKSGKATVVVTPEGWRSQELFNTDLTPYWKDQVRPLDAYAGKVVRIDLRAVGDVGAGRAHGARPRCSPQKLMAKAPKNAKNVVVAAHRHACARAASSRSTRPRA